MRIPSDTPGVKEPTTRHAATAPGASACPLTVLHRACTPVTLPTPATPIHAKLSCIAACRPAIPPENGVGADGVWALTAFPQPHRSVFPFFSLGGLDGGVPEQAGTRSIAVAVGVDVDAADVAVVVA